MTDDMVKGDEGWTSLMSLEARGGIFGEGESSDIQDGTHPERLEEPLVLSALVLVLQQLLDLLL